MGNIYVKDAVHNRAAAALWLAALLESRALTYLVLSCNVHLFFCSFTLARLAREIAFAAEEMKSIC